MKKSYLFGDALIAGLAFTSCGGAETEEPTPEDQVQDLQEGLEQMGNELTNMMNEASEEMEENMTEMAEDMEEQIQQAADDVEEIAE